MSDFESAATSLAAKSAECLNQIEAINHRLEEFESVLRQRSEQLISQSTTIEEAFQNVSEKLTSVQAGINDRFELFFSNCSQVHDMIVEIRAEFQSQYDNLRTSLEEGNTPARASSADQDASWQTLQSGTSSLTDGCTEIQTLSESVTADVAGQIADSLAATLAELEAKLSTESTDLTDTIEEQALALIVGKSGEFASQIESAGSQLKGGLQDAGAVVEQSLSGNLEVLTSSFEESVASILELASSISDTFGDVSDTIADSIGSVSSTFDVIDDVTDASNAGLRSALKVFEEAKELLEKVV